jgi:hypothetical protein
VIVNNSTNNNKTNNHLWPSPTEHKKTRTYEVRNPSNGLGQTHKCGGAKPVNGIKANGYQTCTDSLPPKKSSPIRHPRGHAEQLCWCESWNFHRYPTGTCVYVLKVPFVYAHESPVVFWISVNNFEKGKMYLDFFVCIFPNLCTFFVFF